MRQFGVSRATARKAMEMLTNNGLITRRRGKGSEVISNVPSNSLQYVTGCMKKNVSDNVVPQKHLVDADVAPISKNADQALELEEGVTSFRLLRRVRYSGDIPFYLETIYYEDGCVPYIEERDFSKESLRAFSYNSCGISWKRATQNIRAVVANAGQADRLNIKEGDPLLLIKRVSFDKQTVPRE